MPDCPARGQWGPLLGHFKLPPGADIYFGTTTNGKPFARISGPQGDSSRHWAPEHKENQQVASSNSKAYKVVLTDGTERTVEANSVAEADGRLRFTGAVEGYEADYNGNTVASFLSENVVEYGLVPVPEQDKTGDNTYQVNLSQGGAKTVQADRVLYTKGSDKGLGQFTFVTKVRSGETRTEFLIGEDKVESIERLTDGTTIPAQDGEKLTASA